MNALRKGLARVLGGTVTTLESIAGGDINDAYRAQLQDGRRVFVKTHARPPTGMYEREAEGLRLITCANGPRIPEVLWAGDSADGAPAMLVLEWIASSAPTRDHDERLGRELAALHRSGCGGFGLPHDNFIGSLPQDNRPLDSWVEFYAQRRLQPMIARAVDAGHIPAALLRDLERLLSRLDDHMGDPEPATPLHGDLWGGNAMTDELGQPVLIDPAAHGGHREVDLAMMRLFGGFSPRCFAAYAEAHPLQPGSEQRVGLYQLYPLLVHLNLFGPSYLGSVRNALAGLV